MAFLILVYIKEAVIFIGGLAGKYKMPMWSKLAIGEGSNDALRALRKEATNVFLKENNANADNLSNL